ncbi:MAG: chorismate mutase [Bdellovibrionales bacterium]|nr:chorismate mutase [Bdellovibrionales bacterium]
MNELEDLRKEIDRINIELARLIERRLKVVDEIFQFKSNKGLDVYNPVREQEMFNKITKEFEDSLFQKEIIHFLKIIVEYSKLRKIKI